MGMTKVPHAVNVASGMEEKHKKEQKQTRSAPSAIPVFTSEPRWYISPFDGEKKRTWDNPAPEYAYKVKIVEASQAPSIWQHDL